jgi:hypothetical protein
MLGTPQMATESNQAVQWQASYDAFGQSSVSGTVTQPVTENIESGGQVGALSRRSIFRFEDGRYHEYQRKTEEL